MHNVRKDFVRRLAHSLNVEYCDTAHHSPETVIHKAEELVQEVNRLRTKGTNVETQLAGVEVDFRTCRDALDRAGVEKDQLQRQISGQLVDIERLRQVWRSRFRPSNKRRRYDLFASFVHSQKICVRHWQKFQDNRQK